MREGVHLLLGQNQALPTRVSNIAAFELGPKFGLLIEKTILVLVRPAFVIAKFAAFLVLDDSVSWEFADFGTVQQRGFARQRNQDGRRYRVAVVALSRVIILGEEQLRGRKTLRCQRGGLIVRRIGNAEVDQPRAQPAINGFDEYVVGLDVVMNQPVPSSIPGKRAELDNLRQGSQNLLDGHRPIGDEVMGKRNAVDPLHHDARGLDDARIIARIHRAEESSLGQKREIAVILKSPPFGKGGLVRGERLQRERLSVLRPDLSQHTLAAATCVFIGIQEEPGTGKAAAAAIDQSRAKDNVGHEAFRGGAPALRGAVVPRSACFVGGFATGYQAFAHLRFLPRSIRRS